MDTTFKATHVIVATSYKEAEQFGLGVGAQVVIGVDDLGEYCANSETYKCDLKDCTVEPIKPASLFTEEQLTELEGLYGLVRVEALR